MRRTVMVRMCRSSEKNQYCSAVERESGSSNTSGRLPIPYCTLKRLVAVYMEKLAWGFD